MLFDHGAVDSRKRILVHRAAGNVGAHAVQMAKGCRAQASSSRQWLPPDRGMAARHRVRAIFRTHVAALESVGVAQLTVGRRW